MADIELPFKAEYARSGRAGCKFCKNKIGEGTLRLAAMVQSAFHDSKQPNWFHMDCFFKKQRPASVGDIDNFSNLRYEDQQTIEKSVAELGSVAVASGSGKGKKRGKATANAATKDYGIEYAKSGRATCVACQLKISKDEVRIKKTVFDTEVGMKYGGQALWHHVECFAQVRNDLGWLLSGDNLPGYETLSADDKSIVKKALPTIKDENLPEAKKAKLEPLSKEEKEADLKLEETIKKQSKRLFEFRDEIKQMSKPDMQELLERNKQEPVQGNTEKLYDQVADLLAFGAIQPCPECKGTQLLFNKSGYLCNGQLTEWVKCAKLFAEPEKKACKVPSVLKSRYGFLSKVKSKPEKRAFRYVAPSVQTITKNMALKKHDDEVDGPKVKRDKPTLYGFQFAHIGMKNQEEELKKRIAKLGGKLDTKIHENIIAIFSTAKEVKKMSSRMHRARELGIHVVPLEYLESVESDASGAVSFISSMTLCDWGTDPSAKVPKEETKSMKSKSIYTKSVPKSLTLKVKDGLAVDPDSGLEDVAHVYVKDADKYNAVLGLTDLQANKNSYYKLQILESDKKNKYWLFRSWGRIGTTIGGNKLENFDTAYSAIDAFINMYFDKTGNHFAHRDMFEKVPGKMYPIDIDYSDDKTVDFTSKSNVESKLNHEVQDLIKLLFDVDTMKRTMLEFDLDMEKMPLGKLSQKQMQSAYKVLTEVYTLIQEGASNARFIDATNRFYTLIPHDFGIRTPPLLDTTEQIEKLRQMLDSLMEIECAYSMLKQEDTADDDVNPLDKHYAQLKTQLEPLDKSSDEFSTLQKYVKNTHAETHKSYELEIINIFKVVRQGEARRFKPFKKLHNRKLLWHGSRLTNFAGILSHGLKIAPPEAPVTGYMFGKGIYFADMVSKSANYCCTSSQNSTGLMLLSEVALGDMFECTQAKYVTELPKGKHSCFGHGATMPDPKESIMREDGVEIPLGKPFTDRKLKSSLLYNEYIVYDIAQVNIQYMLQLDFKYKY